MPLWRTVLVVVASLAFVLGAARPGHAQQAPVDATPSGVEAPSAAAPAPEIEPAEVKTVTAFSAALETWANEIKTQEQAIADATTTDEELRAIPDTL
jgi:hypothetical protein